MCEITTKVHCPHYHRANVVKNGKSRAGIQRFMCRGCGKHFQHGYLYWGASPLVKRLATRMLGRCNGIRDCAEILHISKQCVSNCLSGMFQDTDPPDVSGRHQKVRIDEFWTYVGRKKNKRWLLYAYGPGSKQILTWQWGKRDTGTARSLYGRLENADIDWFCTDDWKAFAKVLPYTKHLIGKSFTKDIEGVNTSLGARNKRTVRRTTCFSKKNMFHEMAMKMVILNRNHTHQIL
ncbi:IS1 family transposase [Flammeovirgaceae bacterium SG7u.111]|nr:IS1 family transposase [Flammeovirgaceae bacterium SG7u.132]WPO35251.1 IS1 family transposase [Flammeovirgaceae bacterium SG7u.111]